MSENIRRAILTSGAAAFASLLSSCMPNKRNHIIPASELTGAEPNSARHLGVFSLDFWSPRIAKDTTLHLIQVSVSIRTEVRAYLERAGKPTFSLGHLAQLLPEVPADLLYLDVAGDRFFIGQVRESVRGTLDNIELQRYVSEKALWWQGVRKSIPKERVFIFPIPANEANQWNKIAGFEISTSESLRQGWETKTRSVAFSRLFDPPIDLLPHLKHT